MSRLIVLPREVAAEMERSPVARRQLVEYAAAMGIDHIAVYAAAAQAAEQSAVRSLRAKAVHAEKRRVAVLAGGVAR